MATITCLPEEMIHIILGYKDITIEDIINFTCVCKKFQHVAKYNNFKEKKYLQRWPITRKHYDKLINKQKNEQNGSEENEQNKIKISKVFFIETGINCKRHLQNFMPQQIQKYYSKDILISNLSFTDIFELGEEFEKINLREVNLKPDDDIKISFYVEELRNLYFQKYLLIDSDTFDLMEMYHNVQLYRYLHQHQLNAKISKFQQLPNDKMLFEESATFVARTLQLFPKDVRYESISKSLNNMIEEILNSLREKHPDHSIFSTSAEYFAYWRNNNIDDNHWNKTEGTQIMDTLEEYIFGKLNFRPRKLRNIEWNTYKKHKCIDYVLEHKCGQEILIYVIFHSVARRLGLRCDIISNYFDNDNVDENINNSFFLFWKPSYARNNSENVRCFQINSNTFPNCFIRLQQFETFEIITANEMMDILSFDTIYFDPSDYELRHANITTDLINLNSIMSFNSWSRTFINEINTHYIVSLVMVNDERWVPNARSEEIKFAVGMIVTHSNESTDCPAGVIIGWHRYEGRFSVKIVRKDRRYNPNIYPLKICSDIKKKQTRYFILTENDEMCYVEEDTISLTTPKSIVNSEIGRYFNKFEDTHYVPNKALAKRFPLDAAVTATVTAIETKSQT
ncbi:uncharacterized protein [Anoplolepis gracilipes]|uniref:uncharacterized protein n=1 Tax=Anoplolepis gracilipes TaxID=354296 RepID=UPI003BA1ED9A